MLHLGDIAKIKGDSVPIVDCVIFGAPCQDLSVAGKRKGMKHEAMGDDETTRSGLFHEAIRIIKEIRENDRRQRNVSNVDVRPRYAIYENVPGAFSSNKGEDFRVVLEEVARISEEGVSIPRPPKGKWETTGVIIGDGYSIAWRVFDAQYWGVPQRRRRICLVADFNGHSAAEILFNEAKHNGSTKRGDSNSSVGYTGDKSRSEVQPICEGLSGDTQPSQETRESSPTDASGSIGASNPRPNVVDTVALEGNGQRPSHKGDGYSVTDKSYTLNGTEVHGVAYSVNMDGRKSSCDILEDKFPTLCTTHYGEPAVVYDARGNGDGKTVPTMTGDHQNRVTDYTGIVVEMDRAAYNQGANAKFDIGISEDGVAHTVIAKGPGAVAYLDTTHADDVVRVDDKVSPLQARDYNGGKYVVQQEASYWDGTQVAGTLTANNADGSQRMPDKDTVNCVVAVDCRNCTEDDVNGALQASSCHNLNSNNVVRVGYIVRRFTPMECERLQGFPDGWTDIGEYTDSKGKKRKTSDASRYKALGNSIALPSWKFVLKRICANYERPATMASLFDGIGGFPLIWEGINGKGSCLWASEIEDFPIAVTKEGIG